MKISFHPSAWEQYVGWQSTDKAMIKKINRLLEDIQRHPFEGIGKPEALRHDYAGYWSRRITDEHRLVYAVDSNMQTVFILQCRYHYA